MRPARAGGHEDPARGPAAARAPPTFADLLPGRWLDPGRQLREPPCARSKRAAHPAAADCSGLQTLEHLMPAFSRAAAAGGRTAAPTEPPHER